MKRYLTAGMVCLMTSSVQAASDKAFCERGGFAMSEHIPVVEQFVSDVKRTAGPIVNMDLNTAMGEARKHLSGAELRAFEYYAHAAEALFPALNDYLADARVAAAVLQACADAP